MKTGNSPVNSGSKFDVSSLDSILGIKGGGIRFCKISLQLTPL